jgi:hypothetical protein
VAATHYSVGLDKADATFGNPVNFEGRLLPRDVVIKQRDGRTIRAHLETIEVLGGVDETFFQPPPDAKPFNPVTQMLGLPISGGVMGCLCNGPSCCGRRDNSNNPIRVNISADTAVGILLQKTRPYIRPTPSPHAYQEPSSLR